MKTWPKNPVIYEINTWVWLAELQRDDRVRTLGNGALSRLEDHQATAMT